MQDINITFEELTKEKADDLLKFLEKCSDEYYKNHNSLISDETYDRLVNMLEKYGVSGSNVVTSVGSDLTSFSTIKHDVPMLSLKNTYTLFSVIDFVNNIGFPINCQPKLDGISISLVYNKGKLISGSTRGNGIIGDDITEACKNMVNVPSTIPYNKRVEIRGEAIMSLSKFKSDFKDMYSNPRNLVSGTMKSKDASIVSDRHIEFIAYYLISNDVNHSTYLEDLLFIKSLGIETNDYLIAKTANDVVSFISSKNSSIFSKYPTDGVVLKLENKLKYNSIGFTAKYPKWAVAYKYESVQLSSDISYIDWRISRNGVLTPVAILNDTLDFDGVKVSQVTLHNASFVINKKIRKGSLLSIERSGEVIPHVTAVYNESDVSINSTKLVPDKCPYCSSGTKMEGVNLICTNKDCAARLLELLFYFVSKTVLDIKGFGYSTIKKLMKDTEINLKDIGDIFTLYQHKDRLVELFGEKTSVKLLSNIELAKSKPAYIILRALNLPGVGTTMSKLLLNKFGSIDNIFNATKKDLLEVNKLGNTIAETILHPPQESIDIYNSCKKYLNTSQDIKNDDSKKEHVVITGTFNKFTPRKILVDKLDDINISVTSSVSKNIKYVIAGNNPSDAKISKAKKLGIPIYDEEYVIKNILK